MWLGTRAVRNVVGIFWLLPPPRPSAVPGRLPAPRPPGGGLQRPVPPCIPSTEAPPLGLSVDLGTEILVPVSWYQDPGTRILVPTSWYQDPGTKILGAKILGADGLMIFFVGPLEFTK